MPKPLSARTEIETAKNNLTACEQDFEGLEKWWPKSSRSMSAQGHIDSLKERVKTALQCSSDALALVPADGSQDRVSAASDCDCFAMGPENCLVHGRHRR